MFSKNLLTFVFLLEEEKNSYIYFYEMGIAIEFLLIVRDNCDFQGKKKKKKIIIITILIISILNNEKKVFSMFKIIIVLHSFEPFFFSSALNHIFQGVSLVFLNPCPLLLL